MNLKELLEKKQELDQKIKEKNLEVRSIKEEAQQVESELFEKMSREGIEKTGIDGYSVRITRDIFPQVEDWDTVFNYVKKNNMFNLLYKRINSVAFRELVDNGKIPEGIKSNIVEKLSFRNG
jgi:hypothetical protein